MQTSVTVAISRLPSLTTTSPYFGGLSEPEGGAGLAPVEMSCHVCPSPVVLPVLTSVALVTSVLPPIATTGPRPDGLPAPFGSARFASVGTPSGMRPSPVALKIPTDVTQATSRLPALTTTDLSGFPVPAVNALRAPVGIPNTLSGVRPSPVTVPFQAMQVTSVLLPGTSTSPRPGGREAVHASNGIPRGVRPSTVVLPIPTSVTRSTLQTLATSTPGLGCGAGLAPFEVLNTTTPTPTPTLGILPTIASVPLGSAGVSASLKTILAPGTPGITTSFGIQPCSMTYQPLPVIITSSLTNVFPSSGVLHIRQPFPNTDAFGKLMKATFPQYNYKDLSYGNNDGANHYWDRRTDGNGRYEYC